jgi:SAM-dependent methyltransferase
VLTKLKSFLNAQLLPSSLLIQIFREITAGLKVRKVFKTHFSYSPRTKRAIRRSYARPDKFFLTREPSIIDSHSGAVDLARAYSMDIEARPDQTPYSQLAATIHELFLDFKPSTILDVGCSNGWLAANLGRHFDVANIVGVEVLQEQVDWARATHKQSFIAADFTEAGAFLKAPRADLLICMEVGEHLLPSRIDSFMTNLVGAAEGYALISWSRSFPPPDAPPQHIGPLYRPEMRRLFKAWGFKEDRTKTKALRALLRKRHGVHYWWNESATIYKSPRAK